MMQVLTRQFEPADDLWHFRLGGVAADGKWREAAISRAEEPDEWLANNPAEAQALIDAGEHNPLREARFDLDALAVKADSEVDWLETTIPDIGTMTAIEVRDVVARLAQENLETIRAWRYIARRLS